MEFIKYALKQNFDIINNNVMIDRTIAIYILSTFNENIHELNNVLYKNEYTVDELAPIIENYMKNKKINKVFFKSKLKEILDTESSNEIIANIFQNSNELDFVTLNDNINNLFIK